MNVQKYKNVPKLIIHSNWAEINFLTKVTRPLELISKGIVLTT